MLFNTPLEKHDEKRAAINAAYHADENTCMTLLIQELASLDTDTLHRIQDFAHQIVSKIRAEQLNKNGLDALLHEYDLSSDEGIALMCLAEAFLRIPDTQTINRLIRDKITAADWQARLNQSDSLWVNTASWALMLTGKVLSHNENQQHALHINNIFKKMIQRSGEPIIRKCVQQAMHVLSQQFVMGATITQALKRSTHYENKGFRYSYDMLGEAAYTQDDANTYFQAYLDAIQQIGGHHQQRQVFDAPSISIKLSALHPRYEFAQRDRVLQELTPRLSELAQQAQRHNIGLTIDAEESTRLELSLDLFAALFAEPCFANWPGLGLAVQAYQKRAPYVIDWLIELAQRYRRRIMLRLVKGAYWDSEIKYCQERGLADYSVFTRKANTDISYLACAKRILTATDAFYPQFATHNAHTIAAILEMAQGRNDMEFQCLHGMGHNLYDHIVGAEGIAVSCRIYAPVGSYKELLPYLVRRLLENGANTSFVNRIANAKEPIMQLIADPIASTAALADKRHPHIPLPHAIYGDSRRNAMGIDLTDRAVLLTLAQQLETTIADPAAWQAAPLLEAKTLSQHHQPLYQPHDRRQTIGHVTVSSIDDVSEAVSVACNAYPAWSSTPVEQRAACLETAADLLEQQAAAFIAVIIREAGKTIPDAVAEMREAVDFLRYYAQQARTQLSTQVLQGATGEYNQLSLHGRGAFVCISPWNFPLAIFIGQVSAALAAGNTVLAKPAEQTPLTAYHAVKLLHSAGIPRTVLQYLPGSGHSIGHALVADPRIAGVMFTGSTQTAKHINQTLANRPGAIIPFIAETGGQNAMLVDSSALPEQVVTDVLHSAFGSAGQRCSALRVLFLQEDIATKIIHMLRGAMAELRVGDPGCLATDIGPVIDQAAHTMLTRHFIDMQEQGELIYQVKLDKAQTQHGTFFAPCAFSIKSITQLSGEIFGPFLHVVRYQQQHLPQILQEINATGYGLTLGIHSRINETIDYIQQRLHVGNTYVNRNMIGAVVGVQPFGGEGLSGTGPKAGGPHYLPRLCTERTLSINTAAAGGNASLMSLNE